MKAGVAINITLIDFMLENKTDIKENLFRERDTFYERVKTHNDYVDNLSRRTGKIFKPKRRSSKKSASRN